jgi:hypothetical protein
MFGACFQVPAVSYHWAETETPVCLATGPYVCHNEASDSSGEGDRDKNLEGVADGGIAAASNEAAQPASEKATPEADNPAPKPVRDLAARAGAKQNSLFGGKGKKIPTVGGVVILDGNGNVVGGDMTTIGTDPGPCMQKLRRIAMQTSGY